MILIGHHKQRHFLKMLSQQKSPPQSYLFVGPPHIGKKEVALEFAGWLIGVDGEMLASHPDIFVLSPRDEIDALGKGKRRKITIEQVREIIFFLSRYPTAGSRRVVVVDDAEELTSEAENALLKILEEPNSTSILVLLTYQPDRLLPTTRSRLLPVVFEYIKEAELRTHFRGMKSDHIPDFFFTLGMPGLIVKAIADPESFREHQQLLRSLFRVSKLSVQERLVLAETLANNEVLLPDLLIQWLMGLHQKITDKEGRDQQKMLLLFDQLLIICSAILKRQGNLKLLLEKLLLPL